ncbi:MAG: hypothetical protein C5B59_11000 [Bacteroidetes bacterium]|nr:MAG: hypothetical protein C5B59_11000 [Bacteroidota bacterium]
MAMQNLERSLIAYLILVLVNLNLSAQSLQPRQVRLSHFDLQSEYVVSDGGDSLSLPGYIKKDYWYPVKVPCTVLSGLVANKVYPDPYIGMNNMLIPDASDYFNQQLHLEQYSHIPYHPNPWKKPYWYRAVFYVPSSERGKLFQLIFKGINYRAEVWLNGAKIADSSQMAGMFADYYLDVSNHIRIGENNGLAVRIFPLDFPGIPSQPQLKALGDFYANGGPFGDIGKNVTMLCSVGWDWIPEVKDRNMGIWQPVYLRSTGAVQISKPQVITELPSLPDTSVARLSIKFKLKNLSTEGVDGKIRITISPENFSGAPPVVITRSLSLDSLSESDVAFSADSNKLLSINRPAIWWPNGYGQPNLYRMRIQYLVGDKILDESSFPFGIRTVSSEDKVASGWYRRDFYVNGRRVHLVGGAWVPDMMLNRDSTRYDYELRLCRNANVNLVRIWGGGLAETDDFYELADRYGLMVWQDFWVTGDTQGEFKGSPDWPIQGDIFIKNVVSTIYRIRNHPSLLVWTGGNEGHARKELYDAMREDVATLDGTRPFIPSSSGFAFQREGWKRSWPDDRPAGVYSGGPYSWQDAKRYYNLADSGKDWVFKDEVGLPSQPPYSILPKIIPNLIHDDSLPFPLNNTWGYHDACTGNGHFDLYYKSMVDQYGVPTNVKDYCDKMQLMNGEGYRGIFESVEHKLKETGGVMLWKLNSAFPSVMWQIYDWWMVPNAGYYYMQNACKPVHIQFNLDDSSVAVINRSYRTFNTLKYDCSVSDIYGNTVFKKDSSIYLDSIDVEPVLSLKEILSQRDSLSFVDLNLRDAHGNLISHNVYWLAPKNNYSLLSQLQPANVECKMVRSGKVKDSRQWVLQFANHSDQFAFFIHSMISHGNEELLPSFWSDNYFSLKPHESITVTVSTPTDILKGRPPVLQMEGWNVRKSELTLPITLKEGEN